MRSWFAIWISPFRAALGYNQAQAANHAEVEDSQWGRWDKGNPNPRTSSYGKIARGLEYERPEDWLKDFMRFAGEHPEYVDKPWDEKKNEIPVFVRQFGKLSTLGELREPPPRPYHVLRERPLILIHDQLHAVPIEEIESEAKREELRRVQRRLKERAGLLEEDIQEFCNEVKTRASRNARQKKRKSASPPKDS